MRLLSTHEKDIDFRRFSRKIFAPNSFQCNEVDFSKDLRPAMQIISTIPMLRHSTPLLFVRLALTKCEYVFVHNDKTRGSLHHSMRDLNVI